MGQTITFLGRTITHKGDHFEISLTDGYTTTLLQEMSMEQCNPATTPGTTSLKATVEDDTPLNTEEHVQYRRIVGKLQMDDLHQTRSVPRNQGTSQIFTTAISAQPKEG